jgi:fumarate reductase flavoprotein subunit
VGILKEGPRSNYKGRFPMFFLLSPHNLWVNKKGRRFIDEGAGYMAFESVNALLMQPDCIMYSIFDSATAKDLTAILPEETKHLSSSLPPFALPDENEFRKIADSNTSIVKISDSWDEVADWIGANPVILKDTVNKYNSFYYRGYDEEFAKDVRLLHPVNKAPYYAIKGIISMIDTMGGIKTNEFMEVLDIKENIIPGLYAAGVTVDGFEGHTYDSELAGSALGFSINSGRIAGESAGKFISMK